MLLELSKTKNELIDANSTVSKQQEEITRLEKENESLKLAIRLITDRK